LRDAGAENAALLAVRSGRAATSSTAGTAALQKALADCNSRIASLREGFLSIEGETMRANSEEWKAAGQVRLARQAAEVETLAAEVDGLARRLETLERRLGLMRQRRSQYASLFTENPDPTLRIRGSLGDILRRFAEQHRGA
jgi:predicted  nucleic acid-binding Zn-ribbon protein